VMREFVERAAAILGPRDMFAGEGCRALPRYGRSFCSGLDRQLLGLSSSYDFLPAHGNIPCSITRINH
jgi:hypothetical protein